MRYIPNRLQNIITACIRSKGEIKAFIVFSVLLSCAPVVLAIIFDWLSGYNFPALIVDHSSDFILVVFAVAGTVWGLTRNISNVKRLWTCFPPAILVLCCAFFSFTYRKNSELDEERLFITLIAFLAAFIISVIIGIAATVIAVTTKEAENK